MTDLIAISVKTRKIYSGCPKKKEFSELICINIWTLLYLFINQIDSCHGYEYGPYTWDTKNILWMKDYVLIMCDLWILATGSPKFHRLDMT